MTNAIIALPRGRLVVGFVIGRWWGLVLAALLRLAYIPAGEGSDGDPAWFWALVFFVPSALIGLALGVSKWRSAT